MNLSSKIKYAFILNKSVFEQKSVMERMGHTRKLGRNVTDVPKVESRILRSYNVDHNILELDNVLVQV